SSARRPRRPLLPDPASSHLPPAIAGPARPQPTRLVGRGSELDQLQQILLTDAARLVTLTGPAGVGKTRLALEGANNVGGHLAQSVCFVDLTPIRDPELVPATLAHGIGLQDTESGSLLERLSAYLQDRDTLLILDNFERVLPAGPYLVHLLGQCPAL